MPEDQSDDTGSERLDTLERLAMKELLDQTKTDTLEKLSGVPGKRGEGLTAYHASLFRLEEGQARMRETAARHQQELASVSQMVTEILSALCRTGQRPGESAY
ncbi:hypothetical protein ACFWP3_16410 [Streptomyces sp. NPDC058525]|uniref:hypothetical protein n=1 Tax=Streptomyces sp. NPDC058525 TaxID=3346538 RepID=UPI00366764EB